MMCESYKTRLPFKMRTKDMVKGTGNSDLTNDSLVFLH